MNYLPGLSLANYFSVTEFRRGAKNTKTKYEALFCEAATPPTPPEEGRAHTQLEVKTKRRASPLGD